MRVQTLEVVAEKFKTEVHFVSKDDKFSWTRLAAKVRRDVEKRGAEAFGYGSTVAGARNMFIGGSCVTGFVFGMLFREFLGREKFSYAGGLWLESEKGVPTELEGWVNGMRGVEYKKGFSGVLAPHLQATIKAPTFYGWNAAQKEEYAKDNGELGVATPVEVEKWPRVALVWGHDEEIPTMMGRYWTLTTPRAELTEMVKELQRKGKEERINAHLLCWKILKAVPKKLRTAEMTKLLGA